MTKRFFLSLFAGAILLTACSRDDDNKPAPPSPGSDVSAVKEYKQLNSRTTNWVYFSFDKNEIVEVKDPKKDLNWDVAFLHHYIKTNGGESGQGKGEVAWVQETKDFDAVKEAASTLKYDKDVVAQMSYGSYPNLTKEEQAHSVSISGKYGSKSGVVHIAPTNTSTWPSVYAPTKNMYIVKTAAGKYAKFQVTDFYNDKNLFGYYTFKYQVSSTGKF